MIKSESNASCSRKSACPEPVDFARLLLNNSESSERTHTLFYINLSNPDVQEELFYAKTMENYLSTIKRNHGYRIHGGN
jgi:hypothetical protein